MTAHIPVLLREAIDALQPRDGGVYVDATFGRGGYTRAILDRAACRVIAIDRDPDAMAAGAALHAEAGDRLTLKQGPFADILPTLAPEIDGIAFDLGVSSPQLDDPARGFSFREDGPLDMRMGAEGPTAADLVNTLPEADLADIIYQYGEERRSRAVAKAIVAARGEARIERTQTLAALVRRVVRPAKDGLDPATRTFQGLRIAVNDELGELRRGLGGAERCLRPGGRLAIVSFHSLEDRAVKRFLATRSGRAEGPSRHQPVADAAAGPAPTFRLVTRKPVTPTADEARANPRARSARLRVAERTDAAAWPIEEAA